MGQLHTLAEKLEFSNALRKQHERERSAALIELGKMTAYVQELEHKLRQHEPPISRAERKEAMREKVNLELKRVVLRQQKQIKRLTNTLGTMLARLHKYEPQEVRATTASKSASTK